MFKNIYTTKMSGNGKILAKRFERINARIMRGTKTITVVCILALISALAVSSLVFAGVEEDLHSIKGIENANSVTPEILYPCEGCYKITAPFVKRVHPVTGEEKFHRGVDFAVPEGTVVRAGIKGNVTKNGYDAEKGNYVIITNDSGVEILYAHLSQITRRDVYTVTPGDIVGKTGNTGMSTGPHLHMEVKINGEYVNPEDYLK